MEVATVPVLRKAETLPNEQATVPVLPIQKTHCWGPSGASLLVQQHGHQAHPAVAKVQLMQRGLVQKLDSSSRQLQQWGPLTRSCASSGFSARWASCLCWALRCRVAFCSLRWASVSVSTTFAMLTTPIVIVGMANAEDTALCCRAPMQRVGSRERDSRHGNS